MAWLEPLLAGVAALAADQLSKRQALALPRRRVARRPFLAIECIVNRSVAESPFYSAWAIAGAWILCLAAALTFLMQTPPPTSVLGAAGIGLALGGITGNFLDLMRCGGIVDFIAIGPWPVFNLADIAIVIGLALTILTVL